MINNGAINNSATIDYVLNKNMITNCLTHIPQDINIELVDGTLTLKAGSKVYVPNGFEADGTTPKFDEVVISSDITHYDEVVDTSIRLAYFDITNSALRVYASNNSGTTAPTTGNNQVFYNTGNNTIRIYQSGAMDNSEYSLPIAIIQANGTVVDCSINQVFNGFGYIGAHGFILPGVKCLIPNGRNKDGSLKNIEHTTTRVYIRQYQYGVVNMRWWLNKNGASDAFGASEFIISETEPVYTGRCEWYKPSENLIRYQLNSSSDWSVYYGMMFASSMGVANGNITSLTPKTTFQALDYNDSATIVGWGAPNYSAGISVSSGYTAPTDGVITVRASGNNRTSNVSINGVQIFSSNWDASYGTPDNAEYRIGARQKITLSGVSCTFYPLLGA